MNTKVVLNRTRDRCCPSPTAESNLNGRFEGPKKKDPAAIHRGDGHCEHGCDKDLSRQDMAGEPFRKDIAAAPDSNPKVPAEI